jgi:hypothetical protein
VFSCVLLSENKPTHCGPARLWWRPPQPNLTYAHDLVRHFTTHLQMLQCYVTVYWKSFEVATRTQLRLQICAVPLLPHSQVELQWSDKGAVLGAALDCDIH